MTSCKLPAILARFLLNLWFFEKHSKNPQTSNCLIIRPAVAGLFQAYRQTDLTKLMVAVRNFVNEPENETRS